MPEEPANWSFEGAARTHLRETAKLTPGERVNRALEITEFARSLATAKRSQRNLRLPAGSWM